jgi:hypothetical protein
VVEPALPSPDNLADPVGPLEVGKLEDVEQPLQLLATYHVPFAASLTTASAEWPPTRRHRRI